MQAPIHIWIREGYKVLALAAKQSWKKESTKTKMLSSFHNEGVGGGKACYK